MKILDRIDEMPVKHRAIAAVLILVFTLGAYYQFIYKKQKVQINVLNTQLSNLNSELQDLRAIKKKLEEFKGMIAQLEGQLIEAQRQLPRQKEIPKLLNDISKFGKESGMEFLSFRPTKETKKGFYAEVPVNLVINGPFHNLANFVDRIVHYPRIIKVTSLNIGSPKEDEGHIMLRTTARATTFRYIEE